MKTYRNNAVVQILKYLTQKYDVRWHPTSYIYKASAEAAKWYTPATYNQDRDAICRERGYASFDAMRYCMTGLKPHPPVPVGWAETIPPWLSAERAIASYRYKHGMFDVWDQPNYAYDRVKNAFKHHRIRRRRGPTGVYAYALHKRDIPKP